MDILVRIDEKIMKAVDLLIIVLMSSLVVMVSFQVLNRFILHIPAAWTEEMARYNFVWVSLYGAVKASKTGTQLSVDILVETMKSEKKKKIINLVSSLFVIIFALILTITGFQYMIGNYGVDCEFGPFPLTIIYSAVPITGILLVFVSIEQIAQQIVSLRGDR